MPPRSKLTPFKALAKIRAQNRARAKTYRKRKMEANGELIAHAPSDIAYLLARLRALPPAQPGEVVTDGMVERAAIALHHLTWPTVPWEGGKPVAGHAVRRGQARAALIAALAPSKDAAL